MLAGEAVEDPQHPLHQPDDFRHHGQHETAEYEMVGYFDEASPLSLLGKQLVAASRRRLIETARKVRRSPESMRAGREGWPSDWKQDLCWACRQLARLIKACAVRCIACRHVPCKPES